MALVVALTVGELFDEAPVEGANSFMKCIFWITDVSSCALIDIEHSTVKSVPILEQIFEHLGGNALRYFQSFKAHDAGNH